MSEAPGQAPPLLPLPPAGTRLRYAILHHTGIPDPHYDLLLQVADYPRLLTWRILEAPATWPLAVPAVRIADHRLIYMEYEGPISNNRGRVARVAAGEATVLSTGSTFQLQLTGDLNHVISLPLGAP